MENFITELFYGNLEPQATNSAVTPKLRGKLTALVQKEEELFERLEKDEKELFRAYTEAYNEFSNLGYLDSFINGFRHGARFAYDAFVDG